MHKVTRAGDQRGMAQTTHRIDRKLSTDKWKRLSDGDPVQNTPVPSGELVDSSGPFVGRTLREDWWILGFGPRTIGDIPPAQRNTK